MLSAVGFLASSCATYYAPEESTIGDYLAARLAAKTNDLTTAAESFSEAQSQSPGAIALTRDAFFYQVVSGDVAASLPYAEQLVKNETSVDDGLSSMVLTANAIKQNEFVKAKNLLAAKEVAPYLEATANVLNSWAIAGIEGPQAAVTAMRENAPEDGYKGFYPLHQALMLDQTDLKDATKESFQLAMMAFGGSVEATAYGAFLERQGDMQAAKEFYELLNDKPGPSQIPARAGLARLETGIPSQAFANTSPSRGAAIAFYGLANGMLQQIVNQRAAAEEAGFRVREPNYNMPLAMVQVALYLDPAFEDARRLTGSILNVYGDNERAAAVLSAIGPSSPYYEQSRIEIAGALNALGETEKAISSLEETARNIDGGYEAQLALSSLFASQGKHEDTVKVMDKLILSLPENIGADGWRYYLSRAASLLELDEWSRAEADMKKALELAPEEATVLNYLGYSWVERGENLDEAFELIEKAVSLEPSSGANIDSLGWAHYQRGNYDEAVGHLEQAASLAPDDPTITDHLGDVYWRLGRLIEAKYQWSRVLELEPDSELILQVQEKLENGLPDEQE